MTHMQRKSSPRHASYAFTTVLIAAFSAAGAETVDLRTQFANPGKAYRPVIITHGGVLNNPRLLDWLDERRSGGTVLDVGVAPGAQQKGDEDHVNTTYLDDPAQFDRLRRAVRDVRARDGEVWVYDELAYPSASAGGRVLMGHPEYMVEVLGCRLVRTDGGTFKTVVPEHGDIYACWAVPMKDNRLSLKDAVDMTDRVADASFAWSAPDKDWVLCVIERYFPDTWKRHNIHRRNVNLLNRDAMARFVSLTHDRYARELGDQLSDVYAFFTDEPQFGSAENWSAGHPDCMPAVQWCDELPEAFRAKKGYDLRTVLPALFSDVGPKTAKYRYDFYDVQSDICAANFYGRIEEWCHDHGTYSSGHMLLEESLLLHVMFSGSAMKNWARMDLPGVDLLFGHPYHTMAGWEAGRFPVPEDASNKLASSVAHLRGKAGVFTESFALGKKRTLRQVLGVTAWQFAQGITHMTTYSIQSSLSAEDYAAFSDFAGRLALVARRGRHVADVAVLVPEASVWAAYTPPNGGRFARYIDCNPDAAHIDRLFRDTCHALSKAQRDFDCLDEALFPEADIRDGALHLADERFPVLVVPEARMLSVAAEAGIEKLVSAGGHVVFVGALPCQSPTKGDDPSLHQRMATLAERHPDRVLHVPDLAVFSDAVQWMANRVPPVVSWSGPDGVRVLHRREPGRDMILVANPAATPAAGTLTFPTGDRVSVWDPETGSAHNAKANESLALEVPGESARIVFVEGA
ncbi:MAG: hypothetical protein GY851_05805 [bacterium]|nr:hypothetical protein [bacterium]